MFNLRPNLAAGGFRTRPDMEMMPAKSSRLQCSWIVEFYISRRMKKFVKPFKRPRVALLVESSRAYGRGILSGVAKFVREHDPWSIFFQDLNLCDDTPEWLKNWRGEGIISRLENRDVVRVIQRLKVPAVYLRHVSPNAKIPGILTDNVAVSRLCFEHLKERGFRHFAFCGFNG